MILNRIIRTVALHAENPQPSTSKVRDSGPNIQAVINEEILQKLSVLNQHLDSMECTTCKNSDDPKKIKWSRVSKNTRPTCVKNFGSYPSGFPVAQSRCLKARIIDSSPSG